MQEVVYLRRRDAGTHSECWTVCAKDDPGAVAFAPVRQQQPRAEAAEEWYSTGQPVPYKPADGQW